MELEFEQEKNCPRGGGKERGLRCWNEVEEDTMYSPID